MSQSENEILLFSNEKAIYRIALTAKVVSWVILAIYTVFFVNTIISIIQGPFSMPKQFMDILRMFAEILQTPAFGLFFFLTLQGIANGLYLGLDLIYEFSEEEE
ncbi:MAG: hypothetical protein JXA13_11230 [Anaerolineales bacterium]|nr:hypothetical protein [Anaerolineales bacterium]